jgi:hypothetical protein
MTLKRIIGLLAVAIISINLTACTTQQNAGKKAANQVRSQDVLGVNQQVIRLRQNEPLPTFSDSAALHVQDAYYTADSDPNKIWYVTMVSNTGVPYAHYTTRGAPQPSSDQVTNPLQQVCAGGSNGDKNCDTIGLPEPNGVHQGPSQDYIAISTTGAMLRFPEQGAHISDQPFTVKTPVTLQINESAQISATDESKSVNGIVPAGTSSRARK